MAIIYERTNWINEETPLNQTNMNKIESGIIALVEQVNKIPEWALQPEKPTYTYLDVGADRIGTAQTLVTSHNTAVTPQPHDGVLAPAVHTHTVSQITDLPNPSSTDSGKVVAVNSSGTYSLESRDVTIASGTNNGTIKLTTYAGTTDNIAVKGLKSAAYLDVNVANGVAGLDSNSRVPLSRLDSLVESTSNKVTSVGSSSTDTQYASAKCLYDGVLKYVPTEVSTEPNNMLADKNFVNSSIASATATFRGTSAQGLTEAQFLAWANGLTKELNDYVFWDTSDSSGNAQFKRYKYNGTQWVYEYTLNNSSFTSDQWATINSGITSTTVVKHTSNAAVGNSSTPVYVSSNGNVVACTNITASSATTATNATNATNDGSGNNIVNTYQTKSTAVTHTASTAVGSNTTPVYIDANGVANACTSVNANYATTAGSLENGTEVYISKIASNSLLDSTSQKNYDLIKGSDGKTISIGQSSSSSANQITFKTINSGSIFASGSDTNLNLQTYNLVTSISSSSTDTQYPSAKCVYDAVGNGIKFVTFTLSSGSYVCSETIDTICTWADSGIVVVGLYTISGATYAFNLNNSKPGWTPKTVEFTCIVGNAISHIHGSYGGSYATDTWVRTDRSFAFISSYDSATRTLNLTNG